MNMLEAQNMFVSIIHPAVLTCGYPWAVRESIKESVS